MIPGRDRLGLAGLAIATLATVVPVQSARAHHLLATPHYINDERFEEPVLTAREAVGPWEVEILHAPGNPDPGKALLEVRVFDAASREPYRKVVIATLHRVGSFNTSEVIGSPRACSLADSLHSLELDYPKDGLYWIELAFGEGESRATVNFSVVAGRPGSTGFIVAVSFVSLLILGVLARAILLRGGKPDAGGSA